MNIIQEENSAITNQEESAAAGSGNRVGSLQTTAASFGASAGGQDALVEKSQNVQVIVRVRPLGTQYHAGQQTQAQSSQSPADPMIRRCIREVIDNRVIVLDTKDGEKFAFDYVANEQVSQDEMFKHIGKPIVDSCIQGYNGTIFAYGQTGSGKTFTIQGLGNTENGQQQQSKNGSIEDQRGILPRQFEYLFGEIDKIHTKHRLMKERQRLAALGGGHQSVAKGRVSISPAGFKCGASSMNYKQFGDDIEEISFEIVCSYSEIYNEQIHDLLDPTQTKLQIREDTKKGIILENETQCVVQSIDDMVRLINKGQTNRSVASTNMNRESSRSHAIFTAYIRTTTVDKENQKTVRSSKLNVVDLAGSERVKDTQAEGKRLKEACKINQSLTFLGRVINFLAENASKKTGSYINYRESKLTHLLKDSLGGNSKTIIICTLNPNQMAIRETLSTLKFAERAKKIKNKAIVNEENNEKYFQKKYNELLKQVNFMKQGVACELSSLIPRQLNPGKQENLAIMPNSNSSFDVCKQDFGDLSTKIGEVQNEVQSIITNIKEQMEENQELRSTFSKFSKDFDSFKKSTNFRLNLYQSKESKYITEFFNKYLSSSNQDQLLISELQPLKDLMTKLREENSILKKQVEQNPLASERHAKVAELQNQIKHLKEQYGPQEAGDNIASKLHDLQGLQTQIRTELVEILNKISECKENNLAVDAEGDVKMESDQQLYAERGQTQNSSDSSSKYLKSLSKSTKAHHVDVANIKLKYEEQLEEKNQRIRKLESKNKQYLDIIAQRDENNQQASAMLMNGAKNYLDGPKQDEERRNSTTPQAENLPDQQSDIQKTIRDCKRQLEEIASKTNLEAGDGGQNGHLNQFSKALLEEFVQIIETAQNEANQLTQQLKFYEKEIQALKSDNQKLRLDNDQKFRQSIEKMNENFMNLDQQKQVQAQNDELQQQIKELQEESEEMLTKLSAQDKLLIEKDDLKEKLQQMQEDYENSQKALEYYQNDMIPDIKKNTSRLQVEMDQLQNQNKKLQVENEKLRGSFDDRIKHFERENESLREANAVAVGDLEDGRAQNEEYRKRIQKSIEALNLKTQEALLKEEALAEKQKKMEELQAVINEQTISLNHLEDLKSCQEQELTECKSELKLVQKEKDIAQRATQAIDEKLKVEEQKVADLDQQLEEMMNTVSQQEDRLASAAKEIKSKEEEARALVERETKVLQQIKAAYDLKLQEVSQLHQEDVEKIKELNARIESMSETQLLYVQEQLKSSINKLTDENQSLKQKIEVQHVQASDAQVQILKLSDQIQQATQENSKLLVSGNPEAKAKHFNSVKMDLINATQERAKISEQLRLKEKKEVENLKKASSAYQELLQLRQLIQKLSGDAAQGLQRTQEDVLEDQMPNQFSSIEYAFCQIRESIQKCLKVLLNAGKLSKASRSNESSLFGVQGIDQLNSTLQSIENENKESKLFANSTSKVRNEANMRLDENDAGAHRGDQPMGSPPTKQATGNAQGANTTTDHKTKTAHR